MGENELNDKDALLRLCLHFVGRAFQPVGREDLKIRPAEMFFVLIHGDCGMPPDQKNLKVSCGRDDISITGT
jgi:hypothetical protein